MSFFKMSRPDKADIVFSKAIRERDRWSCQCCGRVFPEGSGQLQNSHFFGRRMESTRFDPENCDALCVRCHMIWENEKGVTRGVVDGKYVELARPYRQWKMTRLGQAAFDALQVRAHTPTKKDRAMALLKALAYRAEVQKQLGNV